MSTPLVSIVVTTKNEEENISNCLKSICSQDYSFFEIILIDNFSTDKTVEIASKFTSSIHSIGPERSAQRNYGLLHIAQGQYAMFIDADMILSKTLIGNCVDFMQKRSNVVGIYIPEIILGNTHFSNVRRFERPYYSGTYIDCVRFFSLSKCKEIGGFDENTFWNGSGEDWDFDRRLRQVGEVSILYPKFEVEESLKSITTLGQAVSYKGSLPCIFHNEMGLSFGTVLQKKIYYSSAFARYVKKWGRADTEIKFQLSIINRLFKIFLQSDSKSRTLKHLDLYFHFLLYKMFIGFAIVLSRTVKMVKIENNMDEDK